MSENFYTNIHTQAKLFKKQKAFSLFKTMKKDDTKIYNVLFYIVENNCKWLVNDFKIV